MRVYQLDDNYAQLRKRAWPKAFKFALVFTGILWSIFFIDWLISFFNPFFTLRDFGVHPRRIEYLFGVIATVFLHGSLSHIVSNTLPLLLAMTALFGNYPKIAKKVFVYGVLLTGILVWSFARAANHIGASGLLYCLLSFLFFSGFIRKDVQSVGISIIIAFAYGSLIFGVIPDKEHISWESHLFGFITGILLSWYFRKTERPVFKTYEDWDDED
ncbi:MAG TPA: rhomboid family intramembrane serine protease [Gammaproteobacteria bacterium]|nr:rhomboid family intramembrane serine protease [Xanthomonadales bacterium]HOP22689.1 rhomboid family intramembrane serine protease [Gammaproteobacteria bacterium]HPI95469.1 rhomboid family intramembrane serine protease [Gammaproteobacteria bacterium]HPQ86603.1 rhomboid family intramembrane serine protease [Gammaproteobacteria bacterium]